MNLMKNHTWIAATLVVAALLMAGDVSRSRAFDGADQQAVMEQLKLFDSLINLITRYRDLSADPATAGVAAVFAVEDHMPDARERITYFQKMLEKVKNATVERAIRLKLVDLYKGTGEHDKALAQLEKLMTNDLKN